MIKRSVFFVSDRTGITAETLSNHLLRQFEHVVFERYNIPFVDSKEKAQAAVEQINSVAQRDAARPLVFNTLVDDEIREMISHSQGACYDIFDTYIKPLEEELGIHSSHTVGGSYGHEEYMSHKARIDAIHFAMTHDDGSTLRNLATSDIILVGVSRTGKTPVCLYMALHYGIMAANYPVTDDELETENLPSVLEQYRDRLFGLSIDPVRLQHIRNERRPGSEYATLKQCQYEVRNVEHMFRSQQIPFINSSTMSIEETCTSIIQKTGLKKRCSLL